MNESKVNCRFPTSLHHTATSHGWVSLAPWQWNVDRQELSRVERLDDGSLATVKVTQPEPLCLLIKVEGKELEQLELERIRQIVNRWLSVDWNPSAAIRTAEKHEPRIATFIREGAGRFLRCSTFHEDFVKTVCTICASWASTKRMTKSLVEQVGNGAFPTPSMLTTEGDLGLRANGLGFRARVISTAIETMLTKAWINDRGHLRQNGITYDDLLSIKGIGPYAASHIMVLEHDFSRIPVDSEVEQYCLKELGIPRRNIEGFFDTWHRQKFLGYKLQRLLRR